MKRHEVLNDLVRAQLGDYVVDALSQDDRLAMERHLEDCDLCRAEVSALREMANALSKPDSASGARPDLWNRIELKLGFKTDPKSVGGGGSEVGAVKFEFSDSGPEWKSAPVAGVEVRVLKVDRSADRVTYEVKMAAGASYPGHAHQGPEECYVLEGDLWVGDVHMNAGDYQHVDAATDHPEQSTDEGCRLLLVSSVADAPLF